MTIRHANICSQSTVTSKEARTVLRRFWKQAADYGLEATSYERRDDVVVAQFQIEKH